MPRRYPPAVCDGCEAAALDHWFSDVLCYCPHNRIIVWRGDATYPWIIQTNMKPRHAKIALAAAEKSITEMCRKHGIDRTEYDRRLTENYQRMKGK